MVDLELVKEKFLRIYPVEENVRERRFIYAENKCELTGSTTLLEMHHCIVGKRRRKFFERFFTVRVVSENAHKGGLKYKMITKFRKEVEIQLLRDFTEDEVRCIMGVSKLLSVVENR